MAIDLQRVGRRGGEDLQRTAAIERSREVKQFAIALGGKSLRGRLKGFDQHLNLVLEETEDTTEVESQKKLGLIIVRGDNVVLISPPPR